MFVRFLLTLAAIASLTTVARGAPISCSDLTDAAASCSTDATKALGITRSQIATTFFPSVYDTFVTSGDTSVFDGGEGCEWTRATSAAPGAVQSADGAYWALSRTSAIDIRCVGGLSSSSNVFAALGAAATIAKSENPAINTYGKITLGGKYPYYSLGTAGFTTANGQSISGCDAASSTINFSPTSGAALTVMGGGNIIDCLIVSATNATNTAVGLQLGIGLNDEGAGGRNVRNVTVNNFDTGIDSVSGLGWTLGPTQIYGFGTAGLKIDNPTCDGGDFSIFSLTASSKSGGTGAGIDWACSGGLKMTSSKLLGGAYGFKGNIRNGQVTQDLQFAAVSIENQSVACWYFTRQGLTGGYGAITIASSECAGAPVGIDFQAGSQNAAVVGNAFILVDKQVHIANGATGIVVGPNSWDVGKPSIVDDRTDFDSEWGDLHWNYTHPFNHVDASYGTLWKIDEASYRGAHIEIVYEGLVQSLGAFVRTDKIDLIHNGTTVVADFVDSNTIGPIIDVIYDTTTTAGSLLVKIRRNQSFGGTELAGTASIVIKGKMRQYVAQ